MGLQPELGDADGPPGHLDPSRSPAPPGSVRPANASLLRAEWKRRPTGLAELGSSVVEKGIQECLMGKEVSGRPD